jgi:hypothetical protein
MALIKNDMGEKDFGRFCEAVAFGENIAKGETGLGVFLTCETLFAPSVINQIRCLKRTSTNSFLILASQRWRHSRLSLKGCSETFLKKNSAPASREFFGAQKCVW